MAGNRQHVIPQFLQRGFASRTGPEGAFVWFYKRGHASKELYTGNVGVERRFYGPPGNGSLDELITDFESDFASFVQELRSTPPKTRITDERLPKLVSHLCLRTRSLRMWAQYSFGFLVDRLQHALRGEKFLRSISSSHSFRQEVRSKLVAQGLNLELIDSAMATHFDSFAVEAMPAVRAEFDEVLVKVRSDMPTIAAKGHNHALHISANPRTDNYARLNWFVLAAKTPLILGDSVCVFETRSQRRFKPLDDKDESIRCIYLPVSTYVLAVGTPDRTPPDVNPHLVNKASARCSSDFFISSTELPLTSSLIRSAGQWSGLMSASELEDLAKSLEAELPGLADQME